MSYETRLNEFVVEILNQTGGPEFSKPEVREWVARRIREYAEGMPMYTLTPRTIEKSGS